jgi:Ca-activated chloride channel family protein
VSFEHGALLPLVVALPLAVGVAVALWVRRRRRAVRALGSPELLQRLGAGDLARTPWDRGVLLVGAALALGIALAGPRWGLESVEEETSSADLVLALDVSKSMLAEDIAPNRLERQRALARRLLRELPGDRIGMVAFAGRAYVLAPMTVDHSALQLYLDALDPDIVSQGGSSLAAALEQATDLALGPTAGRLGTVLLVTDGEALEEEDQVLDAARRAAETGVVVHTVGIGTSAGSPIPEGRGEDGVESYKRDENGDIVISRLNEPLLREVADLTRGQYVRLGEAGASNAVLRTLQGLDRAEGTAQLRVRQQERYGWFVMLALALLVADGIVASRDRAKREPGEVARAA